MTRRERAIRRCHRADVLAEQAKALLATAEDHPMGSPERSALFLGAMALHERAAAWTALAGGDAEMAREHLAEARWLAQRHRRRASQPQQVAA